MRKMSKSDQAFWTKYGISPDAPNAPKGMTTEQLMDAAIKTVQQMTPDEKAILRARMLRSAGLIKSSGGKPS
jgi:hypothetical protein